MGVKKSTVCTSARCRSRRYTPASSKVLELTSTLRSNEMGSCGKTCRRACWLNLEAHPAHDESEVSLRICSRDTLFTSFRSFCHSERSRGIPLNCFSVSARVAIFAYLPNQDQDWKSKRGEDRNRTYLVPPSGTTAVLKTARATRHPSLSRMWKTPNAQSPISKAEFFAW
jgi:hypothetical protein